MASITDIKPDITTLMAIHTRVTLTAIQFQHVIIQFDGLGALNEWILSYTNKIKTNRTKRMCEVLCFSEAHKHHLYFNKYDA